ncbi:MAG TPA: hypothetical protein VH186_04270 [Chloroflexia bacterium]|nr:hypothetical protein [Chloroflexia bacterium]
MRGQLEEARKRREAEARELARRKKLSENGNDWEVPYQRIVIVGPCASGKTMLADALRDYGYNAHPSAQEHSYVQTMWRMTKPSHLIYLDADLETIKSRRRVSWGQSFLDEENQRLAHARENADIIITTNKLTQHEVVSRAIAFLEAAGVAVA